MAYKTVKVRRGDTFASLAQANQVTTADLLKLNRGVPQLSTGQVIKVPQAQYPGHGTIGTPSPFPVNPNYTVYSGHANIPAWSPKSGPFDTNQNFQTYVPPPVVAQGTQGNFPGHGTITGQTTSGTLIDPNAFRAAGTATQARPDIALGAYTGDPLNNPNDAAWVNYWNDQAANPPSNPPPVMTADQIWNMKAAQRRRQQEQAAADGPSEPKYQPIVTQNVAWRVG